MVVLVESASLAAVSEALTVKRSWQDVSENAPCWLSSNHRSSMKLRALPERLHPERSRA